MKELLNVRQRINEPRRRWFSSNSLDLIVWISDEDRMIGFELCYDKLHNEHSISWSENGGFRHMAVDDGEQRPGKYKATPMLVPNGHYNVNKIQATFHSISHTLPQDIANFVSEAFSKQQRT